MSDRLFLGIDGGGTSTTAWLADRAGKVVGRGVAGPSNLKAVGAESARRALDDALAAAFAEAGLARSPVEVACLGLAGFDRPEDKVWLESWSAESRWADRLVLVNDGDLVVAAGTPEGWGVGLIAGTGSIAVGRAPDGRTARAGGWGYLIGDEGSAYAVAIAGLRKIARQADGRDPVAPSSLADRICRILDIGSTKDLVSAIYRPGVDRARLASIARAVVAAAPDDPSIGREILEPAGLELARMVEAVAGRIGRSGGALPLAMAGSFLLNCQDVYRVVLDQLSARGFRVEDQSVADPVEGALVLARRGSLAS